MPQRASYQPTMRSGPFGRRSPLARHQQPLQRRLSRRRSRSPARAPPTPRHRTVVRPLLRRLQFHLPEAQLGQRRPLPHAPALPPCAPIRAPAPAGPHRRLEVRLRFQRPQHRRPQVRVPHPPPAVAGSRSPVPPDPPRPRARPATSTGRRCRFRGPRPPPPACAGRPAPNARPWSKPRNQRRLSFSRSASGSTSGRAHVSRPLTPNARRPSLNATAACTNRPRALLVTFLKRTQTLLLSANPV